MKDPRSSETGSTPPLLPSYDVHHAETSSLRDQREKDEAITSSQLPHPTKYKELGAFKERTGILLPTVSFSHLKIFIIKRRHNFRYKLLIFSCFTFGLIVFI